MYRSCGEFDTYARKIFRHFNELNTCSTTSEGEALLDRASCREALYVLLGYHPSDSLLDVLTPSRSSLPIGSSAHGGCVHSDVFVSFARTAALHDGQIATHPTSSTAESLPPSTANADVAVSWLLFKSLARGKEYIVWEDIAGAMSLSVGDGAPLVFAQADTALPIDANAAQQRERLLSHVFALLDSDRDGRLVFSDVKDYLKAA